MHKCLSTSESTSLNTIDTSDGIAFWASGQLAPLSVGLSVNSRLNRRNCLRLRSNFRIASKSSEHFWQLSMCTVIGVGTLVNKDGSDNPGKKGFTLSQVT